MYLRKIGCFAIQTETKNVPATLCEEPSCKQSLAAPIINPNKKVSFDLRQTTKLPFHKTDLRTTGPHLMI